MLDQVKNANLCWNIYEQTKQQYGVVTTPPPTQPAPCTTHARPSLPVNQNPNPTPASYFGTGLHDTAAMFHSQSFLLGQTCIICFTQYFTDFFQDDYFEDYSYLRPKNFELVISEAQDRVARRYITSMLQPSANPLRQKINLVNILSVLPDIKTFLQVGLLLMPFFAWTDLKQH